jgi:hypothetical protein
MCLPLVLCSLYDLFKCLIILREFNYSARHDARHEKKCEAEMRGIAGHEKKCEADVPVGGRHND